MGTTLCLEQLLIVLSHIIIRIPKSTGYLIIRLPFNLSETCFIRRVVSKRQNIRKQNQRVGARKKEDKKKIKRFKYASITWYQPQTLDVASE